MASPAMRDQYDAICSKAEARAWSAVDTLSGEDVLSAAVDGNSAVIIFQKDDEQPHMRTVVLTWLYRGKWSVTSDTKVKLPRAGAIEGGEPVCLTSNTPENVPSVTPSVTITGHNRDRLTRAFKSNHFESVATLLTELGVYTDAEPEGEQS